MRRIAAHAQIKQLHGGVKATAAYHERYQHSITILNQLLAEVKQNDKVLRICKGSHHSLASSLSHICVRFKWYLDTWLFVAATMSGF
jgi:cobalamin biosynthesis Co2+ chelatase CbiK